MLNLDAESVAKALPYDALIRCLGRAFADAADVPTRIHLDVPVPQGNAGNLLLMPAWQQGGSLGVKIATVFPDNHKLDHPAVFASYVLMSATTGMRIAVLDGSELTLRRTAAASALASSYLSRVDAKCLLMVGTGNLAPHLVAAHCEVRSITEVLIWGRRNTAARKLAETLSTSGCNVSVVERVEDAVERADIVSCATLASEPLVKGAWLQAGQHLDLVGSFRPDMAEADTEAIMRSSIYVDTRDGTFAEAGEIVQALQSGSITKSDVRGELSELAGGSVPGRRDDDEITLFKSVGTALEDLAAAELAVRNFSER